MVHTSKKDMSRAQKRPHNRDDHTKNTKALQGRIPAVNPKRDSVQVEPQRGRFAGQKATSANAHLWRAEKSPTIAKASKELKE